MIIDDQRIAISRSWNICPPSRRELLMSQPTFGSVFTDHMFTAVWRKDIGWHDLSVRAREPFSIDPACASLHYAQEIFEGMKAYRSEAGELRLFRPDRNAARFSRSAARMAMPAVPERMFVNAVRALVDVDREWVPAGEGSLYLRPFMFASEAFLGMRPAAEYVFCVIACPVGPYFAGGERAIRLWVTEEYVRAAHGGTGEAKCGGNYAGSLRVQAEAKKRGCDQVVYLDAAHRRYVEELGGMNLFFVMRDGRIVTPPLSGTILPGITRESLIELARDRGLNVEERPYSFGEWRSDAVSGTLAECFACGTAAVVAGIGEVLTDVEQFSIGDGREGSFTKSIRSELLSIQRGDRHDERGWSVAID